MNWKFGGKLYNKVMLGIGHVAMKNIWDKIAH